MSLKFTKCTLNFETLERRMIRGNRCHGVGVTQNITQNIYINKLIINGSPGSYDVQLYPTIFQKLKQAIGLYPKTQVIENAVRVEMLGEKVIKD